MLKWFRFNWRWRKYQVFIINTEIECRLYLWENWREIMPHIGALLTLTEKNAYIRTSQTYQTQNKWLGFGRMNWTEQNNNRWTTKYRLNNLRENQLEFYNTQIWAPDWNVVCKTGMPPDIFVQLYNNSGVHELLEGLVIALPRITYKKNRKSVDAVVFKVADLIKGAKIYQTQRDWWHRVAERNNIEDVSVYELLEIIRKNT